MDLDEFQFDRLSNNEFGEEIDQSWVPRLYPEDFSGPGLKPGRENGILDFFEKLKLVFRAGDYDFSQESDVWLGGSGHSQINRFTAAGYMIIDINYRLITGDIFKPHGFGFGTDGDCPHQSPQSFVGEGDHF